MCGICGYIGYNNSFKYGFTGISKLLNRGYDSVGVTTINVYPEYNFVTHKYASDENELADSKILKHQSEHKGNISIFHSRWRTTGANTDINSHPHHDMYNIFSLVHNGIIENYKDIKCFLEKNGYIFKSETDTEAIVNLISYHYRESRETPIEAIKLALSEIEGTYALGILCIDYPNNMYCVRHGSPLLVGFTESKDFAMIASECCGFDSKITNYIVLDNNDIISLKKDNNIGSAGGIITMESHENKIYDNKKLLLCDSNSTPYPFKHWTLKEIHDQSISCVNAIGMGGRILDEMSVKIGGIDSRKSMLLRCDNLILLGCGTSYHAGLLASSIFKYIGGFNTVQVFDGADFLRSDVPLNGETCYTFISQSGETKDLHRCLELCKSMRNGGLKLATVGIVNVVDSLIAREVDCGIYLNCGREIGVASTKAFSSQIIVLTLLAIWFAQNRHECKIQRRQYIAKIMRLQSDITSTIEKTTNQCKAIAKYLSLKHSVFVLGKGISISVAKEGALKLKEIGYIHAEAYSSSALKHGPYALMDKNFPVIMLIPDDTYYNVNKIIYNELKCRDTHIIVITDAEDTEEFDQGVNNVIKIPRGSHVEIMCTIILQLISYYLSIEKKIDPDHPKNISKTISVD